MAQDAELIIWTLGARMIAGLRSGSSPGQVRVLAGTAAPLRNGVQQTAGSAGAGGLLELTNMGLSNAERQRRHRERLKAGQALSRVRYRRPKDRRSKAQRWSDAVQELIDLQAEYQAWLDSLPENLQSSAVAEQLEAICELDLDSLQDVEPPRGFGRD